MTATVNLGELLNLVGLATGVVLYTTLLVMVVRPGRQAEGQRLDPLLLLTSLLGLLWNVCALSVYELPRVGFEGPFPSLSAAGFSALGFLPAVVVHSVLRGGHGDHRGTTRRAIAAAAYAVSGIAATIQLRAVVAGAPIPSVVAMRLLTFTFIGLVVPLAAVTRGQPGARRALWAAALAVFAVSALHLSQLHQGDPSWPVELVGHHASLPLALAILYQDYPFALADLFLKRALALLAIVVVAFTALAEFGVHSPAFGRFIEGDPRQVTLLVTLWVATALLYPELRRLTTWFVDTIVLQRPDYGRLWESIAARIELLDRVEPVLSEVCAALGPALSARTVTWQEWHDDAVPAGPTRVVVTGAAAAAVAGGPAAIAIVVPTTDRPRYALAVAGVTGGRRFLSDDVAAFERLAIVVARRLDAIRLTEERYAREIREQEMATLASEAELRALRAQINPHFLFNALTTIGYLIQTAPARAFDTLMRLTSLLRAVLRSEGNATTLGREIDVVEAYLDIEQARFEDRLVVRIDVDPALRSVPVPPLVLQPLVENAVKHGIGPREAGGSIHVAAIAEGDEPRRLLRLVVTDTGVGSTAAALARGRREGVGLKNVERRLDRQYGAAASLRIRSEPGIGTTVEIRLPVAARPEDRRGEVAI